MALAPKFAAHRLLLADGASVAAAGGALPLHTIELFLDYVCPFSARMFATVYDKVVPALQARAAAGAAVPVQVVFRHQVQPWHPSSTLVHETALAVQRLAVAAGRPELFWTVSAALFRDQRAYMDVSVAGETRNATYARLAAAAAAAADDEAVAADDIYAMLTIPEAPTPGCPPDDDSPVNAGNAVTDDLKLVVRAARLVGVHVSPTVLFDGLVNNDVSSGWTVEQWLAWLDKVL